MKFASKLFNKLKYITMIVLVSTVVSCDSWLDLGSEDRIMENTLFSSQTGFMTALNGVYIELLNANLYGGTLSYKTFDVLAQYYDCDKDEQAWQRLSTFSSSWFAPEASESPAPSGEVSFSSFSGMRVLWPLSAAWSA